MSFSMQSSSSVSIQQKPSAFCAAATALKPNAGSPSASNGAGSKPDSLAGASTLGAIAGSVIPGVGTAVGSLAGSLFGLAVSFFSNHKHPDQVARDQLRNSLQQLGFLDQNYQVALVRGGNYSLAADGSARLQSLDGSLRHPYDVDFSQPLASQIVAWVDPLASLLTAGNA